MGLNTTRQAISSALVHETLCVTSREWSLTQALARVSGGMAKFLEGDKKAQEGETSELRGAKVCSRTCTCSCPALPCSALLCSAHILFGSLLSLASCLPALPLVVTLNSGRGRSHETRRTAFVHHKYGCN